MRASTASQCVCSAIATERWSCETTHKEYQAFSQENSVALRMSNHSMRRVLHKDLNFYPYKMAVVQELSYCDMANLAP
jgi:predicted HD phosphohydrolase